MAEILIAEDLTEVLVFGDKGKFYAPIIEVAAKESWFVFEGSQLSIEWGYDGFSGHRSLSSLAHEIGHMIDSANKCYDQGMIGPSWGRGPEAWLEAEVVAWLNGLWVMKNQAWIVDSYTVRNVTQALRWYWRQGRSRIRKRRMPHLLELVLNTINLYKLAAGAG